MTNVVSRDGYNIPKVTYDGTIVASGVTIGDAEDFDILKEQVKKSGLFVIRRTDPAQPEYAYVAAVESPISVVGYRAFTTATGMVVRFITISTPSATPNEMVYTGVSKAFATT